MKYTTSRPWPGDSVGGSNIPYIKRLQARFLIRVRTGSHRSVSLKSIKDKTKIKTYPWTRIKNIYIYNKQDECNGNNFLVYKFVLLG